MKFGSLAILISACALSAACEEELDPVEQEMRVPDAGTVEVKVSNVGTACSLLNRSCQGSGAQCLEISYSGAFYPGGYCTADCRQSEECGPEAVCPVGDAERTGSDYKFRSTWARKCFRTCGPGAGSCRAGYACISLADVYQAEDAPEPMHTPVCVPRFPSFGWDAGTARDAGAAKDAGLASDGGALRSLDAGR